MKAQFTTLFVKDAHRLAKILSNNNSNTYRENLSIAMKVKYIGKPGMGNNDIHDINFVMNNIPLEFIKKSVKDYHKSSRFTIKVYTNYTSVDVEIKQYEEVDQSYMNTVIENRTSTQRYLD